MEKRFVEGNSVTVNVPIQVKLSVNPKVSLLTKLQNIYYLQKKCLWQYLVWQQKVLHSLSAINALKNATCTVYTYWKGFSCEN